MSSVETAFTALTANLGRCSRGTGTADRALQWLADSRIHRYDLLLLQECPDLSTLEAYGFQVRLTRPDTAPKYRCRSAVAVRKASGLVAAPVALEAAEYHRTYVAAAVVEGLLTTPVTCVSVHASPTPLTDGDRATWKRIRSLPSARTGGGTVASTLWDADLVLETLAALEGPVLAAGDWNEARAWDDLHPGETWGREFFERVRAAGLVDVPHRDWKQERVTRKPYQLDHVFASEEIAGHIRDPEVIEDRDLTPADHSPIQFVVGGGSSPSAG